MRTRYLIRRTKLLSLSLVVLLLTEIVGASLYFDIHNVTLHENRWRVWVDYVYFLFPLALAFSSILILIEVSRWKTSNYVSLVFPHRYGRQPWLFLHLLAFTGFATLTAQLEVDESFGGPPEKSTFLVIMWVMSIPVFVFLWLRIFAPLREWWGLLWKKRYAIFVAGFITGLIWIGSEFTESLWYSFNDTTFRVVHFILALHYPDVVADAGELVLGTPAFQVVVADQCSGYEGMGLVTIFLAVYLWLFRQEFRFPRALLLFPVGLAVIWIFNALRIAALIAIGSSWSPEIAMNGSHSQAGWTAFLLVTFGLMWAAGRCSFLTASHLRRVERRSLIVRPEPFGYTQDSPVEGPLPGVLQATQAEPDTLHPEQHPGELATALLIPFIVLMAAGMLIALFSDGSGDALYPIKIAATGLALWIFRRSYQVFIWQWSWIPLLTGAAVFVVWVLLEPQAANANDYPGWLADLPAGYVILWLLFRVLGSVLLVPLAEEMLFRGYLLRKLVAGQFEAVDPRRFTWLSFLVSSVLFGLLHQRWLAGTLAGMAFAYAQYRQGRLADAVLAHASANALIAMEVLGFGQWGLWS